MTLEMEHKVPGFPKPLLTSAEGSGPPLARCA
jgi:hypothetical protein